MKTKCLLLIVMIGSVILSSCRRDTIEPKTPGSMEELKVPANFDWKTTKDYTISFFAASTGMVEVSGTNNIIYQRAYLGPGMPYDMKLTLPTYEKKVKLRFQDKTAELILNNTNLTYRFN